MRRAEATALVGAALALVMAGLTWLFGPLVLIGAGVVLLVVALFVVNVEG